MTKQELIDNLNDIERISAMSADELIKWYVDLIYEYREPVGDDSLYELIQDYWPPEDVADYLIAKLQSPVLEIMDALQEVSAELQNKEFKTRWSYYETDWGLNFVDVTKENLEKLRQRILAVLEEEDDKEE